MKRGQAAHLTLLPHRWLLHDTLIDAFVRGTADWMLHSDWPIPLVLLQLTLPDNFRLFFFTMIHICVDRLYISYCCRV